MIRRLDSDRAARQHLLNVRAELRRLGAPDALGEPIIAHQDRAVYPLLAETRPCAHWQCTSPGAGGRSVPILLWLTGEAKHEAAGLWPGHFAWWSLGIRKDRPADVPTAVWGVRQRVAVASMRCILHQGQAGDRVYLEIDFDRCNPDFGLALAFGHAVERLWPGPTNPFAIARALRKRGADVEILT